jgi:fructoselysine-6-P-deglycase FrlB-like protein
MSATDEAMDQAGVRVMALVRSEAEQNPNMPTAWLANHIFNLTCGPGEISKFSRWAAKCYLAQMIAELRGEAPVDAENFEELSDDPDELIAQAEAMRAHAAALAAYRDERGAA